MSSMVVGEMGGKREEESSRGVGVLEILRTEEK